MVVRAARAEVQSAKQWRRPSFGPGARSRSADPRMRLEPLPRATGHRSDVGEDPIPRGDVAEGKALVHGKFSCPTAPRVPSRIKHRAGSAGARPMVSTNAANIFAQVPSSQPSLTTRRPLLRQRSRTSRTPSSASPAWEELNEAGGSMDSVGSQLLDGGSEAGHREAHFKVCDDFPYDEADEHASGQSYVSDREDDGDDADVPWDGSPDMKFEDSPELQAIEAAITAKQQELRGIEANQAALTKHLETSEQDARGALQLVTQLEADLVHKEAKIEATELHHAPRRSARMPTGGVARNQFDLDNLVGEWSQARMAMGITDNAATP